MSKDFDAAKVQEALVAWIREYFEKNTWEGANAVLGISGGKDSTVAAALCTLALGKERVVGVMMPDGVQPDIEDSRKVIAALGIRSVEVNIGKATSALAAAVEEGMEGGMSRDAKINMPPRLRMATLYGVAQTVPHGGLVINTCNLSEDYVGYSTKYGDSAGDITPLSDLTATEVMALGKQLETIFPMDGLTHKTPSDGLCGLTDEDRFGFTYAVLDRYIREGVCEDEAIRRKIDEMHRKNLHKLQLMPKFTM